MSRETVGSIDPFGPTADPASYVPRRASDSALTALATALAGGAAIAALSGPPGLGKTLVLRVLERRLADRHTTVWLPYAALAPDELFAWTLGLLGEPSPGPGRAEAALLVVARDAAALGQPLIVLIDDASAMPAASAERVGALVRASAGAMQVVAAGLEDPTIEPAAGTDATLWVRALGPATVRVRLLEPMHRDDVARLLRTRLEASGAPASLLARVDETLVRRIHTATAGVPRDVNALASEWLRRGDVVLPRDIAPPEPVEASSLPAAAVPRTPGAPVSRGAATSSDAMPTSEAAPASNAPPTSNPSIASGVPVATRPPLTAAPPDAASAPTSSPPSHPMPPAPRPPAPTPAAPEPVVATRTPAAPTPGRPTPNPTPSAPPPPTAKPPPAPTPPPRPAPAPLAPPVAPLVERPAATRVPPAPTPGRAAPTPVSPPGAASIRREAESPEEVSSAAPPVAVTAAQAPPPLSRPASPTLARAPRRIEIFIGVLLLAGAALLLPWLREGSEPTTEPPRSAPQIAPAQRGERSGDVRDALPDRESPPPAPAAVQRTPEPEPEAALAPAAASPAPPLEPDRAPEPQPEPVPVPMQDDEARSAVLDAQDTAGETPPVPSPPEQPAHEATVTPPAETAPAPPAVAPEAEVAPPAAENPPAPPEVAPPAAENPPAPPEVAPPAAENPPAPPEVAPPPIGVHINAVPWAVIEVDGVDLGETPLSGVPLVPGPHRFRARLPDGRSIERTVDVSDANRHVSFE